MNPEEIVKHCNEQMELAGDDAEVGFLIRGSWGKRNRRRLCAGGPEGEIAQEMPDGMIYVFFNAREVKEFMGILLEGTAPAGEGVK